MTVDWVPVIVTARLRLRGHRYDDFERSAEMWADPVVTRHIGGRPFTRDESWLRMLRYPGLWALLGYGYWLVEEKETGRFVGEVGFADFKRDMTPPLGSIPEAGWVLASWAHRKGFATEALRAALTWADATLPTRETVCIIDPDNTPSLHLAHQQGYQDLPPAFFKDHPVQVLRRPCPSK